MTGRQGDKAATPVLILIGSDSDLPKMQKGLETLEKLGVGFKLVVASAHRTPEKVKDLASSAQKLGFKVIIAAAGLAAHLPGAVSAWTTLPIIGVPINAGTLGGLDALYSIVQMPPGMPVAAVGIDNAVNAALLSAQILALGDPGLDRKIKEFRESRAKKIAESEPVTWTPE